MLTVILGAGAAGLQLARRLSEEGKDVALIEKNHDVARVAANGLDCLVVQGDGSEPETLERAGLAKARHFVALTGSDELNIVTSSVVAAEYPAVTRVARARNPYFLRLNPSHRSFMGVDRFVNPDVEAARAFMNLATEGSDGGIVRFPGEDLILRTSRLQASSPLAGRPLREGRAALGREFLVAALDRGGSIEVPSGNTVPLAGDLLYILGAIGDIDALLGLPPEPPPRFRRVVVAGGGATGRFLAGGFLGSPESEELGLSRSRGRAGHGRSGVVILEPDMAVCKRLARDIPGALVLNRELGDEDLFLEEGLSGADLFLAVTPDQELNLLAAGRAKDFGIGRSYALAENNAYLGLVSRLGVDGVVSMKSNIVSSIIEYLRGGALTTLHSFFDRGVKVLEFSVGEGSHLVGRAIRDLALPKGALVIFVHRAGRSTLPAGDTVLAKGDRLGIFTSMAAIRGVESLFLGEGA